MANINVNNSDYKYESPYANLSERIAMLLAPANSAAPEQVTTGQREATKLTANPTVAQSSLEDNLEAIGGRTLGNVPVGPTQVTPATDVNYGLGRGVIPANAQAISDYAAGLNAARAKDARGVNSPGFNERVYRILNGDNGPTPQLPRYFDTQQFKEQVRNLNDGPKMVNPNTDESGNKWDVDKLKEKYGFDDAEANAFMSRDYNWRAYNALVNEGIIKPSKKEKEYIAQQAAQERLEAASQAQAPQEYVEPVQEQPVSDGQFELIPNNNALNSDYWANLIGNLLNK